MIDDDTLDETAHVGWWWMVGLGLLLATIAAITLTVTGLAPWVSSQQREQNSQSQQKQDALIRESRSLIDGIHNSNSAEQKSYLVRQFCAEYTEIKQPPPDLAQAHTDYC